MYYKEHKLSTHHDHHRDKGLCKEKKFSEEGIFTNAIRIVL